MRVRIHIIECAFAAVCAIAAPCAGGEVNAQAKPASLETLSNPADAPVSILVFSDYACPYSSRLFFELEALEQKFPGRMRITLKQLPLEIHPQSPLAHEAALAASAQGKLDAMSDLLFANQKHLDRGSLISYAVRLHLDPAQFRRDLDEHSYRPIVDQDSIEARALGIDSTPTLFVNGRRLDGFQTLDALEADLKQELSKISPARAGEPATPSASATDASSDTIGAALLDKLTQSAAEVQGPADAPVTIVEFSDFQCPFCRQTVKPLEDLLAQRPKEVRLIFRSYPLDFHKYSELAHEAALAAGAQGKFWPMHDLIFANQSRLEHDDLVRYAAQLRLDMPSFEHAIDSHIYAGAIAADRALGAQLDVEGTPTLFINGQRLTGARSLVELETVVDEQARLAQGATMHESVVPAEPVRDTDFIVLGSNSAPVRVAWFGDVRSPLAARTASLLRELDREYPGQLHVEYKTMELANHPDAELASRALLAAGSNDRFWPMYDALAATAESLDLNGLIGKASLTGLDSEALRRTMDDAAVTESIERDQAEEMRRAITGSPSIFIGETRIDGIQPERVYKAAIDAAIAAQDVARVAAGR